MSKTKSPAETTRGRSPEPVTPEERIGYGLSLRESTPLASHAEWSPGPERPDPVQLIEEQNRHRLSWLVPVRRSRMSVSAFTFYRGAARIMARDLGPTPVSTLQVDGEYQIRHDPPLIVRVRDVREESARDAIRDHLEQSFADYLRSVPDHVEALAQAVPPGGFCNQGRGRRERGDPVLYHPAAGA